MKILRTRTWKTSVHDGTNRGCRSNASAGSPALRSATVNRVAVAFHDESSYSSSRRALPDGVHFPESIQDLVPTRNCLAYQHSSGASMRSRN